MGPICFRSFIILFIGLIPIHAQLSWNGCPDISDTDFQMVEVVGASDVTAVLKMDFDMDAQGNVDIYYVQKQGLVKMYDAKLDAVSTIGDLNPDTQVEDGVVGIALDPNFKTNRWMYFYYSKDDAFWISRFTFNPTTKQIDLTSEIKVIKIPSERGRWHTSGAMEFDAYGDLWVTVGDNESHERGPANTADLRGGIIRIHPQNDGSYTIPEGNLWEFAADYFDNLNKPQTSAMYRDSTRMKREIYYMGTRNAYTLTLDPVRRWATYGDCGPDYGSRNTSVDEEMTEEHTVVTEPGFGGWPYFAGMGYRQPNLATNYDEINETYWTTQDFDTPINQNTTIQGIPELLPMKRASHYYPHNCAMAGPIYRYDGDLQSTIKMPPHFDRLWLVSDYRLMWIKGIKLSDDGKSVVGTPIDLFTNLTLPRTLDFKQGPDGALYYLAYSGNPSAGIYRIEYTGSCLPDAPKLEVPVIKQAQKPKNIFLYSTHLEVKENVHRLTITNLNGQIVYTNFSKEKHTYPLANILKPSQKGIFIITVETPSGSINYKYSRF